MPKVSVIIPVYNEADDILACLESLKGQSHKDIEIIVVDDGSTDESLSIAKSFGGVRIFSQRHKGAGAARNLGAGRAKGEIFVFVDADMSFERRFVSQLIEPIIEKKAIGTFSKEEYLANKGNVWARCWNLNRGLPLDRMHASGYPDRQKVFRAILKSEFEKAGGFDERAGYTDDWSLSERLGKEARAAAGAVFYHKNPGTLREVFDQSRWMAKRRYKLGAAGYLVALVRISLPVSLISGLLLATYYSLPAFIVFKIVSDFGEFVGVLEYALGGKVAK